MSARIAVVVLNWNGWLDTVECLRSLECLDHQSYSVIVVDNASTDNSTEELMCWISDYRIRQGLIVDAETDVNEAAKKRNLQHKEVLLLRAEFNGGYAYGNNLGVKYALDAGCEMVWILNNDTVVERTSLSALARTMDSDARVGICGSLLLYHDQPHVVQALGGVRYNLWSAQGRQICDGLNQNEFKAEKVCIDQISYVSGASMLVRSAFIRDVGFLEEGYFLYFEELDWALRAKKKSWTLGVSPESVVFHKVGASIGTSVRSCLSQYYMARAMILCYRKNVVVLYPVAIFRAIFEIGVLIYKMRWSLARVSIFALFDALSGREGNASGYRKF